MKIINIKVTDKLQLTSVLEGDKVLNANYPIKIASGNYKSIILSFNFDSTTWTETELIKYATFCIDGHKTIESKLQEIDGYANACFIPYDASKQNCRISIGVYGKKTEDGEILKRVSSETLKMFIIDGAYNDDLMEEQEISPSTGEKLQNQINEKEALKNKTIIISENSTNDQYPSAKAVYDALIKKVDKEAGKGLSTNDYDNEEKKKVQDSTNNIKEIKEALKDLEKTSNKVDDITKESTHNQYPSAKAVYMQLLDKSSKEDTEDLEENQPKGNAEGTSIHIDDSASAKIESVEISGNLQQNTTTGKNLYNKSTAMTNGVENQNVVNFVDLEPSTEYFFNTNNRTWTQVKLYDSDNNLTRTLGGTKTTNFLNFITAENEVKAECSFYSGANTNIEDFDFTNIQIEKGNIFTSYEEYTKGFSSPIINYPQNIKIIEGNIKLKVTNINLLKTNLLEEKIINGITFTPVYNERNELLYINANGTSTATCWYVIALFKFNKTKYAFLANSSDENLKLYSDFPAGYITSKKVVNYDTEVSHNISLNVPSNVTLNNEKIYPMVVEGENIDYYEPFRENICIVDLKGNYLAKTDYISDKLKIIKDYAYIEKNIEKERLLSINKWNKLPETNDYYEYATQSKKTGKKYQNIIKKSTHFGTDNDNKLVLAGNNNQTIYIRIPKKAGIDLSTIELWKQFLDENEIYFYYELEESELIDLGQIKIPKTYKNMNNINLETTLETNMKVKYVRDLDLYIKNSIASVGNVEVIQNIWQALDSINGEVV